MWYLLAALWLLCAASAWYLVCRYLEKKIDNQSIFIGIPLCLIGAPMVLIFALCSIVWERYTLDGKVYKTWE